VAPAALALFLVTGGATAQAPAPDSADFAALRWRNIGPFRGGRAVAVSGVPGDPLTYYMGATGGGVWKTTDAGETWENISDGWFGTGSVGAIAVAESDPNVVYVGMGEHAVRGVATSHGDGVYRSTDGGRTWKHLGLERTRHIARIRVHPANPDLVWVAAQGAVHGPTPDRGIYRSKDGGATWEKVLFVSDRAGASELALDVRNPRILYAAFWDHLRRPWVVESGGPGSGIWKSTDGGDTWKKLASGLPPLMGKIGLDVSRANPDRVYAVIEAEDGGVYRSDDAGATWRRTAADRIVQTRSWYYMEIYADPQDEETVYVMNAPFLRSIDGGRTFTDVRVPHGDNHDLWINPANNRNLVNANDGGANISFNGGRTWSTQENQPTAQFYRVSADNRFPYWLYGGQQDNSSVSIASAAPGGITWKDWHPVSGCESAYLAFDPDRPDKVLGGCYQGLIDVWDRTTGEVKPVMAYPFLGLGTFPRDQKYRFNWNAPIIASPHDARTIYHAGNVLFRTRDAGQSWDVISPDLTRNEAEKHGAGGGPITNEGAGGENYNTILYVAESPRAAGTIWVGTDDGLVQLTRDNGQTWTNVTPPAAGEGMVNAIEASPHDAGTAYVAFTKYKYNDFTPHIWRTADYGRTWTRIVNGIAPEAWVRVVREDPERRGLLYAGTELGMFLSFDDGASWRSWQLNLPLVPVTDLLVKGSDLAAATQGRAFWILDDLSVVRQMTPATRAAAAHLYAPRPTVMGAFGGGGPPGQAPPRTGANPPAGAQFFVQVREAPRELVKLEILDGGGQVIRTYASDPKATGNESLSRIDSLEAGLNRLSWDLRRESLPRVPDLFVYGSLNGRIVPPGRYTARVSIGTTVLSTDFELRPDPRRTAALADYAAQEEFLGRAAAAAEAIHRNVIDVREVRTQIGAVLERTKEHARTDTIRSAGTALIARIDTVEGDLVQPKQKTFQDVINFRNRLNAQFIALLESVDGTEPPLTRGARERLTDLLGEWARHEATLQVIMRDVAGFNRLLEQLGIPPVSVKGPRLVS
jgi:photosystem II stability/assembly factor-like uncharacterized protein